MHSGIKYLNFKYYLFLVTLDHDTIMLSFTLATHGMRESKYMLSQDVTKVNKHDNNPGVN